MQVCHQLTQVAPLLTGKRSAIAIGNFDGVHQGHQALLLDMIAYAKAHQCVPTVLTFYPHPVEVLRPGTRLERLTTTAEKLTLLEGMGVDLTLVATFDEALSRLTPQEFFDHFLKSGLRAASVHVGFNFRFGKDRAGDTAVLESLCRGAGVHLQVEKPFALGESRVSSSLVRELLREGDLSRANLLLGRPYRVSGQVAEGDGRGRKLGFPTANVRYSPDKVLPKNGVYVTRATWQRQSFPSVTNIGVRPTFSQVSERPVVEVHLLDFSSKLYDEFLQVDFLERLRDETKFDSVDALKAQIVRDIESARKRGVR